MTNSSSISLPAPASAAEPSPKTKSAALHVLTLTPFYPSQRDEVNGCFVAESLAELQSLGVESSVIAVDSIYHARRNTSSTYPASWIRYPQIPGNLGLANAGRFLAAALISKISRLHRHHPIDVLHAHAALPAGHAASIVSQRLGIPFVVTVHGLDVFNRCFENGFAAAWRKKTSLRVYRSARKIICISEKVRQLLAVASENLPTEVVYNGTDAAVFSPANWRPSKPTILIVGNLLAGKGHELVLQAISRLMHAHPDLQCHMIGEGADRDRFAALARDLEIADRIFFLGKRTRHEVAAAMRNCTVFVLPSRYEGLGCVYLEAMACAKPVIACQGQGIDEIIRHGSNGWLIPIDGLEELVSGLQFLLNNSGLRERIGEAARATIVQNFTLAHQAVRLQKIYMEAAR